MNSNSKKPYNYDKYLYKDTIKCFFSKKVKYFRHISSHFDKFALNFAPFISFASTCLWSH